MPVAAPTSDMAARRRICHNPQHDGDDPDRAQQDDGGGDDAGHFPGDGGGQGAGQGHQGQGRDGHGSLAAGDVQIGLGHFALGDGHMNPGLCGGAKDGQCGQDRQQDQR